ncbi:MAG: hypothetical protein ACYDGM_03240 [Vulcanimicrobiaceae bacterium]
MRRLFGVMILCSCIALVAAGPSPAPKALVTPSPAPTAAAYQPSVVIYPFDESGTLQPNVGLAVAHIYAQVIGSSPGVKVAAIGANVKRADYLTYAQSKKADYYISGYMTTLGGGAAIVEQVVDVSTGIIKYSQSGQIYDVNDAASLAVQARTIILAASGIDNEGLAQAPQSTPAPSTTNGAQVSLGGLGGIVRSIFKHPAAKGEASPAPTIPPKPGRGMIVVRVGGSAPSGMLTDATNDLLRALGTYYNVTTPTMAVTNVAQQASAICGTNRDNTVVTGTLTQQRVGGGFRAHTSSTFTLDIYACFGATLYHTVETNDDLQKAVEATVKAYQTAHPDNNG